MIISTEPAFIFVHVPRTGGTSVASAMGEYHVGARETAYGKVKRSLGMWSSDPAKNYWRIHDPLSRVEEVLDSDFYARSYKFGFVRNPWDWLVSRYHKMVTDAGHNRHAKVKSLGFDDYIDFEISRKRQRRQHRLVTNAAGEVDLDFVGRFETLGEDFAEICSHLDIEATLPHRNASKHQRYHRYYSDALRAKVAEHWAHDIELFGYDF